MLEPQHPGVTGALEERRAAAPEVHPQRHHHRLAQRIDRWIGDLREALLEIGVETLRERRERRDRRVVAHAPDRVGPRAAHRLEHEPEILEAIAKRPLQAQQLVAALDRGNPGGIRHQGRHVARHPACIGATSGDLALRIEVSDDLTTTRVDHEDFARPHLPALDDLAWIEVHQTHF